MDDPATYAIVGAGFSGMAVAVHLLRRLRAPARVCLINRSLSFGRGLAYGTDSPSHVLNVPAGRMSLDPDDEGGFVAHLHSRGLRHQPGDFVARSLFGDYLEQALLNARALARRDVHLELIEDEVLAIDAGTSRELPVLHLSSGRVIEATQVILALGNFAPKPPPTASEADWSVAPLVNDVWAEGVFARLPADAPVLLVGTGLTAYDAVLRLLDQDHRGPITMLSRRALLPQSHRENEAPPAAHLVPHDFLAGVSSARAQLRQIRDLIAKALAGGHDWRDVIGGLRPHTPRLWAQLDARAKRQFLRHGQPHWDTHRHRAAPAIYRRIRAALDRGQLQVAGGRLVDVLAMGPHEAEAIWRPRGEAREVSARFALIANCTGPSSDLRRAPDGLMKHLNGAGMITADDNGLGLFIDDQYRLVQRDGTAADRIRYVGPLLKATLWEATAVPELRVHAKRLVERLLGD
jgi:uncharacterized NAD(P)/FAD-binding protein YdhS